MFMDQGVYIFRSYKVLKLLDKYGYSDRMNTPESSHNRSLNEKPETGFTPT